MSERVGLNPKWFEPGPDGIPPFAKEYMDAQSGLSCGHRISAAFRALLAEDSERVELRVGDVVRLEEFRQEFTKSAARLSCKEVVGKEAEVTFIGKDSVTVKVPGHWCSNIWSPDALTLVRRAGEAAPVAKDAEIARLTAERDEARRAMIESKAQRDKFWSQRDAARAEVERVTAERDALQSCVDAGVRVWSIDGKDWHVERCLSDNHSATLIIDQPDAAMVDERTGKADRREINCDASLEARLAIGRDHTRVYVDDLDCNGTVKCARSNDRRRVAGTRADRGQAS